MSARGEFRGTGATGDRGREGIRRGDGAGGRSDDRGSESGKIEHAVFQLRSVLEIARHSRGADHWAMANCAIGIRVRYWIVVEYEIYNILIF